jgi:hypothetical protein
MILNKKSNSFLKKAAPKIFILLGVGGANAQEDKNFCVTFL